ncbi:hypothetical protein NY08_929 [Rhodococcus sp. B7740]|nr:hypothetical protein NY08_929 [Rhodococcus sp. B7740]
MPRAPDSLLSVRVAVPSWGADVRPHAENRLLELSTSDEREQLCLL